MNPNQNNFYDQFMNNYKNSQNIKQTNSKKNKNKNSIEIIGDSRFYTDNNFMSKTPTHSKSSKKKIENNQIPPQMNINQNNPFKGIYIDYFI